jgi:hypothetical protein
VSVRRTGRVGGAILLVVALLGLGLSACSDDTTDDLDDSISHRDLVQAAEAIGEQCDPPNPQRVTLCGSITFVDGDRELARRLYEARCLESDDPYGGDLGAWVWYDEGHWEFEATSPVTREGVRVISERLGEAKDCRRDQG